MKRFWVLIAFVTCSFAQIKDLDKLQGTWNIVSLSIDGETMAAESFRSARMTIHGDHFAASGMSDAYEGTIELDAASTPKGITMRFTAGPEKGNTNLGIYELDGDRWRLCLSMRGDTRPAKFDATGTGIALEVMQRVTASDLEGEWSMVSGMQDGQPIPAGYVRMGKRLVTGNQMTVMFGGELYSKGTFTVDRSRTPASIDIQNTGGAYAGKAQLGIYERSGKTLKLSIAAPGVDRPSDFTSTKGDGRTVVVWTLP